MSPSMIMKILRLGENKKAYINSVIEVMIADLTKALSIKTIAIGAIVSYYS